MFGSGGFWDESATWFLKSLKLPLSYSSNFKTFKSAFGHRGDPGLILGCCKILQKNVLQKDASNQRDFTVV